MNDPITELLSVGVVYKILWAHFINKVKLANINNGESGNR